ncbi:MAG: hypothetical protein ACRD5Z_22635, partial [Bryobacteraceae bacterium]
DKRRETRREQLQQRQLERQRERERQLRNQRIRRYALIGVPVAVILIAVLAFTVIGHGNSPQPKGTGGLSPAHGQTVYGIQCLASEGGLIHNHAYLEVYVDGKPVTLPPGVGIVYPQGSGVSALASDGLKSCLYPLHVHDGEPNIIHIESPVQRSYFLGELFDVWGQQLTSTSVMGHASDATHKLVFEVFDANGKLTTVTTDPRQIELTAHETIAVLYNSPTVTPKAYTDWQGL